MDDAKARAKLKTIFDNLNTKLAANAKKTPKRKIPDPADAKKKIDFEGSAPGTPTEKVGICVNSKTDDTATPKLVSECPKAGTVVVYLDAASGDGFTVTKKCSGEYHPLNKSPTKDIEDAKIEKIDGKT